MDRIAALEEVVLRAKGELVVKLFRNASDTIIENGSAINVNITCEEYSELVDGTNRTYYNNIYSADDYYLQFENISAGSQLGLLSYRPYIPNINGDNRFFNPTYAKGSLACYVDSEDILQQQQDNQFIWISDTSGTEQIYNSGATYTPVDLGKVLYSNRWNIGSASGLTRNVFSDIDWESVPATTPDYQSDFPVTIHPYIENIKNYTYTEKSGVNLIEPASKFILPIKIFFKLTGDTNAQVVLPSNMSTSPSVTKKLRVFLEPENLSRPFEFEIIFKVFRNRTYNVRTSSQVFSTT